MGTRNNKGFYHGDCLFFPRGRGDGERVHIDQKNSRLVKNMFLGETETAVRSGIKSRFGSMSFGISDTRHCLGHVVFYLTPAKYLMTQPCNEILTLLSKRMS